MIWNGIYENWDALPPYESLNMEEWVEKQCQELLSLEKNKSPLRTRNEFFANRIHEDKVVIDYGGSLGLAYAAWKDVLKFYEYHVIETPMICEKGRTLFKEEAIVFHEETPTNVQPDAVYMRTSLQYAKDWKKDLNELLDLRPKKVIMAHTSCGNIPTYLTLQNWYGKHIPYWFINEEELNDILADKGYALKIRERYEDIRYGFRDPDGDIAFPETHVLNETANLYFTKNGN